MALAAATRGAEFLPARQRSCAAGVEGGMLALTIATLLQSPPTPAERSAAALDVLVAAGHRAVGNALVARTGGGVFATGCVESAVGESEAILAAIDGTGRTLFVERIAAGAIAEGWDLAAAADGTVMVCGAIVAKAGDHDAFLARHDVGGKELWRRAAGGPKEDRVWAMTASDGDLVLVGETAGRTDGERDGWVLCIDAAGAERWQHRVPGDGDDRLFGVAVDENGDLLAVGTRQENADAPRRALLVRLGKDGTRIDERTWQDGSGTVAHAITPRPDGTFLITGYVRRANGDHDAMVACVDRTGRELWRRVHEGAAETRAMAGRVAPDGTGRLVGYSRGPAGWNVWTMRIDAEGACTEQRTIDRPGDDRAVGLLCERDGTFWTCGSFAAAGGNGTEFRVLRILP